MGFFTKLLNFEEQMTFYASYHHHWLNKWIHVVCIPILLWTSFIWLTPYGTLTPPTFTKFTNDWGLPPLGAAWLVATAYAIYYVLLEPVAGVSFLSLVSGRFVLNPSYHIIFHSCIRRSLHPPPSPSHPGNPITLTHSLSPCLHCHFLGNPLPA